jgi:uncharacterized protein
MKTTSPVPVFDVHHHLGSLDSVVGETGRSVATEPDSTVIDERFQYMSEHGIGQALIAPRSSGVIAATLQEVNNGVAAYRDAHPQFIPAALATLDPTEPDLSIEEADRAAKALDCRGFVFHHHFQGTAINDTRMRPILAHIASLRLPVFIHILSGSTLESWWRLEELAADFETVDFVALDGFSSHTQASEMIPLAGRRPNLYFDTGVLISNSHRLRAFIDTVGPARLLFGTDFYTSPRLFQVPFPLYELLNLDLDDEDLGLIMAGNARRLLGLTG